MKTIQISKGFLVYVDDEDYEKLSPWKWTSWSNPKNGLAYAYRKERTADRRIIWMHRFIMNVGPGVFVDHIDGNGLNNQKSNMRTCSKMENGRYRRKTSSKCLSRFKGVTWTSVGKKWVAQIKANHKTIYLGRFSDEIEAAKKYDEAARIYYDRFALLNFKDQ